MSKVFIFIILITSCKLFNYNTLFKHSFLTNDNFVKDSLLHGITIYTKDNRQFQFEVKNDSIVHISSLTEDESKQSLIAHMGKIGNRKFLEFKQEKFIRLLEYSIDNRELSIRLLKSELGHYVKNSIIKGTIHIDSTTANISINSDNISQYKKISYNLIIEADSYELNHFIISQPVDSIFEDVQKVKITSLE